jgi:hypothetical protein
MTKVCHFPSTSIGPPPPITRSAAKCEIEGATARDCAGRGGCFLSRASHQQARTAPLDPVDSCSGLEGNSVRPDLPRAGDFADGLLAKQLGMVLSVDRAHLRQKRIKPRQLVSCENVMRADDVRG